MAAPELVARCFALRTAAHLAHFKTRSYSEHMALQGLYEDLLDAVDAYAECYQGAFTIIASYPDIPQTGDPITTQINELKDWLIEYRDACSKGETSLANLIDNITAVLDRAAYKLRFLK